MGAAGKGIGVVLGILVIAVGCGGGGGGPPIPIDQLEPQIYAALCHKIFMCCKPAEIAALDSLIVDEASCEASLSSTRPMHLPDNEAVVDAGVATYHGDQARVCLDAVNAMSCSRWAGVENNVPIPECDGIFVGTLPAGSACTVDAECASNLCTSDNAGGVACAAPVALGQSCEFAPCVSGLDCVSNTSGGGVTCGHAYPDGSPCILQTDCKSGFCMTDGIQIQGVCSRPTFCAGV